MYVKHIKNKLLKIMLNYVETVAKKIKTRVLDMLSLISLAVIHYVI